MTNNTIAWFQKIQKRWHTFHKFFVHDLDISQFDLRKFMNEIKIEIFIGLLKSSR